MLSHLVSGAQSGKYDGIPVSEDGHTRVNFCTTTYAKGTDLAELFDYTSTMTKDFYQVAMTTVFYEAENSADYLLARHTTGTMGDKDTYYVCDKTKYDFANGESMNWSQGVAMHTFLPRIQWFCEKYNTENLNYAFCLHKVNIIHGTWQISDDDKRHDKYGMTYSNVPVTENEQKKFSQVPLTRKNKKNLGTRKWQVYPQIGGSGYLLSNGKVGKKCQWYFTAGDVLNIDKKTLDGIKHFEDINTCEAFSFLRVYKLRDDEWCTQRTHPLQHRDVPVKPDGTKSLSFFGLPLPNWGKYCVVYPQSGGDQPPFPQAKLLVNGRGRHHKNEWYITTHSDLSKKFDSVGRFGDVVSRCKEGGFQVYKLDDGKWCTQSTLPSQQHCSISIDAELPEVSEETGQRYIEATTVPSESESDDGSLKKCSRTIYKQSKFIEVPTSNDGKKRYRVNFVTVPSKLDGVDGDDVYAQADGSNNFAIFHNTAEDLWSLYSVDGGDYKRKFRLEYFEDYAQFEVHEEDQPDANGRDGEIYEIDGKLCAFARKYKTKIPLSFMVTCAVELMKREKHARELWETRYKERRRAARRRAKPKSKDPNSVMRRLLRA